MLNINQPLEAILTDSTEFYKQVEKYKEATKYMDSIWEEIDKQDMEEINEYLQKE